MAEACLPCEHLSHRRDPPESRQGEGLRSGPWPCSSPARTSFRGRQAGDRDADRNRIFIHWAAWWSKSIVRANPGHRLCVNAFPNISRRSRRSTSNVTSPGTATCGRSSPGSSASSSTVTISNKALPASAATSSEHEYLCTTLTLPPGVCPVSS